KEIDFKSGNKNVSEFFLHRKDSIEFRLIRDKIVFKILEQRNAHPYRSEQENTYSFRRIHLFEFSTFYSSPKDLLYDFLLAFKESYKNSLQLGGKFLTHNDSVLHKVEVFFLEVHIYFQDSMNALQHCASLLYCFLRSF